MTDPATHPRLAALLAAVLADPGEDAPRLVYADWLEERGDADDALRGEFIRVQCDLRHWPACRYGERDRPGCPCEGCTLRRRERALLCLKDGSGNRVAYRWASATPLPFEEMTFRRGFVERLTCTADAWLAHAEAIRRAHPVREVTLATWPDNNALHLLWSKLPDRGFLSESHRRPAENDHREESWGRFFLGEIWPGVAFTLPAAARSRRFGDFGPVVLPPAALACPEDPDP